MSLWADYHKERLDYDCVERDYGFMSFQCEPPVCRIYDFYVVPSERRSRKAWSIADEVSEIAKSKGCNLLVGYVWPSIKGSDVSMQAMLAYGFKLHSNDGDRIIMTKDIGG
jgi:hypothetical protein